MYWLFGAVAPVQAILRELMETLFKASTTETRTVLPMLGAVMEVDDLLQIVGHPLLACPCCVRCPLESSLLVHKSQVLLHELPSSDVMGSGMEPLQV